MNKFLSILVSLFFFSNTEASIQQEIDHIVRPVMIEHRIPGLAIGLVANGKTYILKYGIASKDSKLPVTEDTLFEIGSISKTFTAALASYAMASGKISLNDNAKKFYPHINQDVTILHLATHTIGGMPLQFPESIKNNKEAELYYQNWKPAYKPGTYRTYSNPSIALLGLVSAKALKGDYKKLMKEYVLSPLRLNHTFFEIPESEAKNYAMGTTKADTPARMSPGVYADEAYGIRTTVSDMVLYLKAQLGIDKVNETLAKALSMTHTGYYKIDAMTQALIWERYNYPVTLPELLNGNSSKLAYEANPVTPVNPPATSVENTWINKTGSTNGFGAYTAFIPSKKFGIVILSNKNFPNEARISLAYKIFSKINL